MNRERLGDPVTVRLVDSDIQHLAGLALMDEVKLADEMRQAVAWYVGQRLSDPKLPSQIETARQRNETLFNGS